MAQQIKMEEFKTEKEKRRSIDRYAIRIEKETVHKAQEKANKDGYSLAYILKCFIAGYLAGDILAETIVKGFKN